MSGIIPDTGYVRDAYACREEDRPSATAKREGYREALAEFDRWLAAHDDEVRDAVKPPVMSAREHLDAAWDAAYEVPKGQEVPAGTPYLRRWGEERFFVAKSTVSRASAPWIRTLDPLPPLIPDDCMTVRASGKCAPALGRTIWQRSDDGTEWFAIDPADGSLWADSFSHLIDPRPVDPEE